MRDLVIVGAGGHGRETLDIVEALAGDDAPWNFLGFADDGRGVADRLARRHASIVGSVAALEHLDAAVVIGIGDSSTRAEMDALLTGWGRESATLVHPLASVASDNRIAPGVVIAAGARVTTNVTLGRHVHLNVNAVVSHDCSVGDHTTLSPGVCLNGEVVIGAGVFLGTGAIVTPGCSIGDGAVIGAGAVVVGDVAPDTTMVGVPARAVGA